MNLPSLEHNDVIRVSPLLLIKLLISWTGVLDSSVAILFKMTGRNDDPYRPCGETEWYMSLRPRTGRASPFWPASVKSLVPG